MIRKIGHSLLMVNIALCSVELYLMPLMDNKVLISWLNHLHKEIHKARA